jgi:spermidine synthase
LQIEPKHFVVRRQSAFQAILLTEDEPGLRSLRFGAGEGRQSVVKIGDPRHLELPYARVLPASLAFAQNPESLLVLGLGGGTLPAFFHSHFPKIRIDVVELDPGVVGVAKEFCGFIEDARMRVHVGDARDFVEASCGGYDMIILDCFDSNFIPAHLTTLEFLRNVRQALAPKGIAVANVWGRGSNRLYAHMLLTYRAAFKDLYILDVPEPGTKIFVALTRRKQMTRDKLLALARKIARRRDFTYDLSDEIAGFRNAESESIQGGAVLTD